jgi:VanZ family protein
VKELVLRTTPGIRALCLVGFFAMTAQLLFLAEPQFANQVLRVVWDKFVHATYFAVMAFLLWVAVSGRAALAVWVAVALIGAADEIHQAFTPGRTCDFYDWLADGIGAAAALIIVMRLAPLTRHVADPRIFSRNGG